MNPFRSLSPDFSHPLGMLAACHGRIENQCQTLRRLAEHVARHGADDDAHQAAENVMRYFDTAGRHHHEDEEQDVFPRVLSSVPPEKRDAARALITRLEQDHRRMDEAWRELRSVLERIAARESVSLSPAVVERFSALYAEHIAVEEDQFLPLADSVLSGEVEEAIGQSMAKRRGVRL
jgi:hemerythrin-like domain-containing protein